MFSTNSTCIIKADTHVKFDMLKFACQNAVKNKEIYMSVDDDDINTIKFEAKENPYGIFKKLVNEFKGIFNIKMNDNLILVTKRNLN